MDAFKYAAPGLTSPAVSLEEVTPSDVADLAQVSRAVYVGGAGDLRVRSLNGTTATLKAVPGGTTLSIRAVRILATGTTATHLVAMS